MKTTKSQNWHWACAPTKRSSNGGPLYSRMQTQTRTRRSLDRLIRNPIMAKLTINIASVKVMRSHDYCHFEVNLAANVDCPPDSPDGKWIAKHPAKCSIQSSSVPLKTKGTSVWFELSDFLFIGILLPIVKDLVRANRLPVSQKHYHINGIMSIVKNGKKPDNI